MQIAWTRLFTGLAHLTRMGAVNKGGKRAAMDAESIWPLRSQGRAVRRPLLWRGARKADGSGLFGADGPGSAILARTFAWSSRTGAVLEGANVMSCVVKECVRPDHLRLKLSKQRGVTGEAAASRRPGRSGSPSARVQVQLNGVRVHRRVRDGRADTDATRAQLREQLQQAGYQDRDAAGWSLDYLLGQYMLRGGSRQGIADPKALARRQQELALPPPSATR